MAKDQSPLAVEWDSASLTRLQKKLGADMFSKALGELVLATVHHAEGQVKDAAPEPGKAPYSVGNTRRAIQSDVTRAFEAEPKASLRSDSVYVWWVEKGEDSRGRRMQTRPGGYRMVETGHKKTAGELDSLMRVAISEFQARWAS